VQKHGTLPYKVLEYGGTRDTQNLNEREGKKQLVQHHRSDHIHFLFFPFPNTSIKKETPSFSPSPIVTRRHNVIRSDPLSEECGFLTSFFPPPKCRVLVGVPPGPSCAIYDQNVGLVRKRKFQNPGKSWLRCGGFLTCGKLIFRSLFFSPNLWEGQAYCCSNLYLYLHCTKRADQNLRLGEGGGGRIEWAK